MQLHRTLLLFVRGTYADVYRYGGRHEIETNNGTVSFRHVHDWSSEKLQPLFFDLTHHDRFFSSANDFSYVELRDSAGKVLFRSPSPALTKLWISPDSQLLVGFSDVMVYNPYQLMVWQRDGTLLHREHISAEVAKISSENRREFAQRFP
jgi:hypothetical protein